MRRAELGHVPLGDHGVDLARHEQPVRREEVVDCVAAGWTRPAAASLAGLRPYRAPERPFSDRNTSTFVACPLTIAATACPIIAGGADPPGPPIAPVA